ncbi:mercury resistance system periplasmic binding protein MerP [Shewanella baltica]|uniref:mercury resistance system periplasmic binding protein MerP n=1 Tax=Shewanella baltica TaxID=62322 RepID=UPI000E0829CB|nr:mercury resistance system periplasmic binding protein MerP [Shewanella baltica]SUI58861.1 Periplasmic mercury ion-binding protein [Shewanella baltica]
MKIIALLFMLLTMSPTLLAKPQSITLDLPTMNCAMCPITVKKALSRVDGVSSVEVSYEQKEAVVNFDDDKTHAAALVQATTNAGYPSIIKE